ncbi:MAG: hypothetical protein CVU47_10025 [Chloroflexi bacterium HGW-Chloroflexi-9]|nr:MAG: hypothetical protein CVU47_10025 [Chloroflexi bacterium HGW-Chloroflexi-9]
MQRVRVLLATFVLVVALFAALPAVASAGQDGGCKGKGCEIPEVPWTLILPGAGAVMAGGYYAFNRFLGRGEDSTEDEQ